MARMPEPEIERVKTEVSVQRLAEARGIRLYATGRISSGCARFTRITSRRL
jgi:hypothetical protein